jgi:redox-sensitive bicupin YhaK (pirin superfamily)
VFGGTGRSGTRELSRGDYAVFANDGDTIALENTGAEPLDALLLSARPVNEPMVRYGPFVMNSIAEIERAFEDFQAGRFGEIKPLVAE